MNKYLLFAQGNFKDMATITYILDALSDVTHSEFLKYRVGDGTSISIHFGSKESFDKLRQYVNIVMSKCSKAYYLVEYNDNMSVFMDKKDLDVFLLIENKNTSEINLKFESSIDECSENFSTDFLTSIMNEFEDDEDDDILLKKSKKNNYDLDTILDKINTKGIDSLTKEELIYLQTFSK